MEAGESKRYYVAPYLPDAISENKVPSKGLSEVCEPHFSNTMISIDPIMSEAEESVRRAPLSCRTVAHCTVTSGMDGKTPPLNQMETTFIA